MKIEPFKNMYKQKLQCILMEEQVKTVFLGQQCTISIQEILQLVPLIKNENLLQILLPKWMSKFKVNLQILQTSLYYVLVVDQNINSSKLFGFREMCASTISNYYISLNMNFQLYQYGYMCSRILPIPLDKVIHILYFMVYARLASRPYINNLVLQAQRKRIHTRKKTILSNKDYSTHSKSHESSRPLTCDKNQSEIQNFKKELKNILQSQTENTKIQEKQQYKKYFSSKNSTVTQILQNKLSSKKAQQPGTLQNDKYVTVPFKVLPHQNSSVITRLKFYSGKGKTSEELSFKKLQVRRQKFNDNFNGCQRYFQAIKNNGKNNQKQIKNDQWIKSPSMTLKDAKNNHIGQARNNKRIYEYFHQLVGNIKTTNVQLDSIRFECSNHINQFATNKIPSFLGTDANLNRHINQIIHNSEGQLSLQQKTKNKLCIKPQRQQKQERISFFGESSKRGMKFSQFLLFDQKIKKMPIQQLIKGEPGPAIVTIKNDKVLHEEGQLMLFNRKVKDRFKLQKYKQQYRIFQKSQIFEDLNGIA